MLPTERQAALPTRSLELISKRCQVPQNEVTRLYEDELAELSAGARVTSFLPIFAIRNIQETLRQRRAVVRAA